MEKFTRYFAGLSWEIDQAIRETEKRKHCFMVECESMNEGRYGRTAVKVTFVPAELGEV